MRSDHRAYVLARVRVGERRVERAGNLMHRFGFGVQNRPPRAGQMRYQRAVDVRVPVEDADDVEQALVVREPRRQSRSFGNFRMPQASEG